MDTVADVTLAAVLYFGFQLADGHKPFTVHFRDSVVSTTSASGGLSSSADPYERIRGRNVCEGSKRMFTMEPMTADHRKLLMELVEIVSNTGDRIASLRLVADLLKSSGGYRWVGLYDVDRMAGVVRNIVWSGPGAV